MIQNLFNLRRSFAGLEPSNGFRCVIPSCDDPLTASFSDFNSSIFPRKKDDISGELVVNYCRTYAVDEAAVNASNGVCSYDDFDLGGETVKCSPDQTVLWNDFEYESNFVTENNLICQDQYKVRARFPRNVKIF